MISAVIMVILVILTLGGYFDNMLRQGVERGDLLIYLISMSAMLLLVVLFIGDGSNI